MNEINRDIKHIITYTPRHKEVLGHAINMALAWHDGNIEPVSSVMKEAFKRHHNVDVVTEVTSEFIRDNVTAIRRIDAGGEAFGKDDILSGIQLTDSGETIITEQEAYSLEYLTDAVMRLIVGQVDNCFDNFHIPYIDWRYSNELNDLANVLHVYCWNMPINHLCGIRYSEESDILYDIHQVLRHERYLNFSEERKKLTRLTVLSGPPLHTAKEPLMKIKTINKEV